ncbi:MAG: hypothetical protein WCO55_01675 [Candidatus Falkowbacteria bacterium]
MKFKIITGFISDSHPEWQATLEDKVEEFTDILVQNTDYQIEISWLQSYNNGQGHTQLTAIIQYLK